MFRHLLRVWLNRILFHRIGLDIKKRRDESEYASRMLSPDLIRRQNRTLGRLISDFLQAGETDAAPDQVTEAVSEFRDIYPARPVVDNAGGSGFADSLLIFVTSRLINPAFIVESGVHRGHSTWLLRQACPDAEIHCFDITFSERRYKDKTATYYAHDWMDTDLQAAKNTSSMIFFDDHIDHALRLKQAHERGFETIILDDDFSADTLYATGAPPLPSMRMIMDDELSDGQILEWQRHGKVFSRTFDKVHSDGARKLVKSVAFAPNLSETLRYKPQSGLTLVRLYGPTP